MRPIGDRRLNANTEEMGYLLLAHPSLLNNPTAHSKNGCFWQWKSKAQTFLFIVGLLPIPSQAAQRRGLLAPKPILPAAELRPQWVLLLVIIVIQDGSLSNGHANDRVVRL